MGAALCEGAGFGFIISDLPPHDDGIFISRKILAACAIKALASGDRVAFYRRESPGTANPYYATEIVVLED